MIHYSCLLLSRILCHCYTPYVPPEHPARPSKALLRRLKSPSSRRGYPQGRSRPLHACRKTQNTQSKAISCHLHPQLVSPKCLRYPLRSTAAIAKARALHRSLVTEHTITFVVKQSLSCHLISFSSPPVLPERLECPSWRGGPISHAEVVDESLAAEHELLLRLLVHVGLAVLEYAAHDQRAGDHRNSVQAYLKGGGGMGWGFKQSSRHSQSCNIIYMPMTNCARDLFAFRREAAPTETRRNDVPFNYEGSLRRFAQDSVAALPPYCR